MTTPRTRQQPPRNRLPSLAEVLRRSTRPPVDLYCFYLFLQREGSEDTLDFWLDVQQHENLCRAYFKDLRKSGVRVEDDWPQYHRLAATRGSIYGAVTGIRRTSAPLTTTAAVHGPASSAASDYDGEQYARPGSPPTSASAHSSPGFSSGFTHEKFASASTAGDHVDDEKDPVRSDHLTAPELLRTPSTSPGTTATTKAERPRGSVGGGVAYPLSPTLRALYPDEQDFAPGPGAQTASRRHKRQSTATPQVQPIIARNAAISRTDLIASAERIFSRYLMPGADKEVYLPASLRITEFPLSSSTLPSVTHPDYDREAHAQALVPDMFHPQKEFVYRALENDAFPRFLRAKAFGNLTPLGAVVRLVVGLIALWAGLATAFAFIFLDAKPKVQRLWIILPFTVAIVNIVAHAYDLDPLMVFMGLTETTPFRTIGIREPYVRKLLFGRALWVTLLSGAIVAVLTVVFWAVPGHRL